MRETGTPSADWLTSQADITTGRVHQPSELQAANPDRVFDNEILAQTADRIVNESLALTDQDRVMILLHPTGWQLASMITERARAKGAQVRFRLHDSYLQKIVLEGMDNDFALPLSAQQEASTAGPLTENAAADAFLQQGLYEDEVRDAAWATKFVVIRNKQPQAETTVRPNLQRKSLELANATKKFRGESKMVTMVYVPNAEEAAAGGRTLEEYADAYYGAADRDWKQVEQVQRRLTEILSNREVLKIKAGVRLGYPPEWYTDLTMNVAGQIPLGSVNKGNYPGGEVFYAPNAGSLEGVYSIPYPVKYEDRMLPNLRLVFRQGRVAEFSCYYPPGADTSGQAADYAEMEQILNTDAGAGVVGEIGFGTNPLIDRPHPNSMYIEKAKGSIHLALGNAYANKDSRAARTDNGNRSLVHWDLTRLMLPEYGGGSIEADGELIQQDGRFVHPDLQYFEQEVAKGLAQRTGELRTLAEKFDKTGELLQFLLKVETATYEPSVKPVFLPRENRTGPVSSAEVDQLLDLLRQAAQTQPPVIMTSEYALYSDPAQASPLHLEQGQLKAPAEVLRALQEIYQLAHETQTTVVISSICEQYQLASERDVCFNTTLIMTPEGKLIPRRKVYDVLLQTPPGWTNVSQEITSQLQSEAQLPPAQLTAAEMSEILSLTADTVQTFELPQPEGAAKKGCVIVCGERNNRTIYERVPVDTDYLFIPVSEGSQLSHDMAAVSAYGEIELVKNMLGEKLKDKTLTIVLSNEKARSGFVATLTNGVVSEVKVY